MIRNFTQSDNWFSKYTVDGMDDIVLLAMNIELAEMLKEYPSIDDVPYTVLKDAQAKVYDKWMK